MEHGGIIGTTLGHYRVEAAIGSGGMGDVYRATDTRLHREVALKCVPVELAGRPERRQRFLREAQSLAALVHPNIVTVFAVEEWEGRHFIAMELVEGRTLSDAIGGGMALRRLLGVGVQVADALAAAHARGVVHRDLKPANVMLGAEDRVKVIDFGLAKLLVDEGESGGRGTSQDLTAPLTGEGRILGTPAYMSPEQVEGRAVDHRSDIFSLGVMLYEMSTGRRPFGGDSAISVVSAIIKDTPRPVRELRPELPAELDRIIRRCLQKTVNDRFQTALDVRNELRDLQTEVLSGSTGERSAVAAAAGGRRAVAGAVVLLLLGAAAWWGRGYLGPADPGEGPAGEGRTAEFPTRLGQYRFVAPVPWSVTPEPDSWPALSPDGQRLTFCRTVEGYDKVFVQAMDRSSPPVQVTFGARDDIQPAWSPDGRKLLFVRSRDESGKIRPSDVYGGFIGHSECNLWLLDLQATNESPRLFQQQAANPAFHTNGLIAFDALLGSQSRIWVCDEYGHGLRPVTEDPDTVEHFEPAWSPDGRFLAFRRQGNKYQARIAVVDLETRQIHDLTKDHYLSEPAWSASGRYIYFTANPSSGFNLWRVPVTSEGRAAGDMEPVTFGAGHDVNAACDPRGPNLVYANLGWDSDIWILAMDAATGKPVGEARPLLESTRQDTRAAWSPDERWLVFTSDREGEMNLYVAPFDSEAGTAGAARRITRGAGGDYQAQWSADGRSVVYFSKRSGNEDLWLVELDDQRGPVGEPRQLTTDPASDINPFFSPDGQWIAFLSGRGGGTEPWILRPDGTGVTNVGRFAAGGHFLPWYDNESFVTASRQGVMRVFIDGRSPEVVVRAGGGHLQLSPDRRWVLENNHAALRLGPLASTTTNLAEIYGFADPKVGVDYSVWSPSGRWVLFDHNQPMGGDLYFLRDLE